MNRDSCGWPRDGFQSVLRLIGFIVCSFEKVVALFVIEDVADASDSLPELVVCSGCGLSDQGLDLDKCHADRVRVGGAGRQKQELGTDVFQDRGGLRASMGGEVVQDGGGSENDPGDFFPDARTSPLRSVGTSWVWT